MESALGEASDCIRNRSVDNGMHLHHQVNQQLHAAVPPLHHPPAPAAHHQHRRQPPPPPGRQDADAPYFPSPAGLKHTADTGADLRDGSPEKAVRLHVSMSESHAAYLPHIAAATAFHPHQRQHMRHIGGGSRSGSCSGAFSMSGLAHFRVGDSPQSSALPVGRRAAQHLGSGARQLPVLSSSHNHHSHQHHHTELLRCHKRRLDLNTASTHKFGHHHSASGSSSSSCKTHPTAVARRNERERNRVKHINSTFATLRQHIPCASKNKKMSKVETLRSAIRYINHLQHILDAQKAEVQSSSTSAAAPMGSSVENGRIGSSAGGNDDHGKENMETASSPSVLTAENNRVSTIIKPHHHNQNCSGRNNMKPGNPNDYPHSRLHHHPHIHLFPSADPIHQRGAAVRNTSSVLLSPPGSPNSCCGMDDDDVHDEVDDIDNHRRRRPESAADSRHSLSPVGATSPDLQYGYRDEDGLVEDEEEDEEGDFAHFADWFC